MSNMIYYKNGLSEHLEFPYISEEFSVQTYEGTTFYSNDSIMTSLQSDMVGLYLLVKKHFFDDIRIYDYEINYLPSFVWKLGISSDSSLSKESLCEWISDYRNRFPNIYRHMYVADLSFILDSIQSLIIEISELFVSYYINISSVNIFKGQCEEGIVSVVGKDAFRVFFDLSNYYIKLFSVMDLITKFAYEMQCKDYDYMSYKSLKCNKIQYGDKKKLKINDTPETLWERDDFMREIESIRHEIIHNGSWQQPQNVYITVHQGEIIKRHVLYPDMEHGHYEKFVNRYHFFGENKTVNDMLPQIHETFLKRLINSIHTIVDYVEKQDS